MRPPIVEPGWGSAVAVPRQQRLSANHRSLRLWVPPCWLAKVNGVDRYSEEFAARKAGCFAVVASLDSAVRSAVGFRTARTDLPHSILRLPGPVLSTAVHSAVHLLFRHVVPL